MIRLTIGEGRKAFADTVNRVAYGGERITLHRRGKDLVAVVPIEDLKLLEALEDRMDLEDARAVLEEMERTGEKPITWEEFEKELDS